MSCSQLRPRLLGQTGLCALLVLTLPPANARADDPVTAPLVITSEFLKDLASPQVTGIDADDPARSPVQETGEMLRSVPGVAVGRAGGHGFEPVIRGQQQGAIAVIADDTMTLGGCPGRMDPPTSFARPGSYDTLTVTRGYRTVTNGPGASGGTIRLDKDLPAWDQPVSGRAFTTVDSNGLGVTSGAEAAAALNGAFVRAEGGISRADGYEDGSGDEVRSGFTQVGGSLTGGYQTKDGSFLESAVSLDKVLDAEFNGMMDSPEATTVGGRMRAGVEVDGEILRKISLSAYGNRVDHVMDTYSLRSNVTSFSETITDSTTVGGKAMADLALWGSATQVGFDVLSNNRTAIGYMGGSSTTVNRLRSYMWPDVTISDIGLFAESTLPVDATTRVVAGGRLDVVYASAGLADRVPAVSSMGMARSANDLYRAYYGEDFDDSVEVNLGGVLRLEHDIGGGITLNSGLSRAVRTADTTERSIASGSGSMGWVGNPGLDPEKHHQIDVGAAWKGQDGTAFISAYGDMVEDYILDTRARGKDGVLRADGARVYTNTTAVIGGIEAGGDIRVLKDWIIDTSLAVTIGQDLDHDRPLAQIPPVALGLGLTYDGGGWTVGGRLRGALAQGRADTSTLTGSGRDVDDTPGWATVDLHATLTSFQPFEIGVGVTNLLDATYAEHLNKANTFDPMAVQVNEPGRSFYLTVSAAF
ncbi:TonB-dependent receptor [Rhodospirillum rubrum]|uniref:TonB-dependent receptor domain-containing protein n=1 Tax=Rhodospirillum rubrum TaxID=1085 RepID=UPI001908A166|nr:TonB-dependent receptor [Rhodospirillum rubrum]MBK1665709.1 TonB-dependent receptor [Rhodospirillum rubrum]MBK1677043.1 TonB-dependent receptor [Rhodospirillum rubrum]